MAAGNVPNGSLSPLYDNTTPGVTAGSAVLDAAIIATVQTVNDNWQAFYDFLTGPIIGVPDQSITSAKIRDLAITTLKLAELAVTTSKIADLNVTTAKIADLAVTAAKIANATITEPKYATGSVSSRALGIGSVDTQHISPTLLLPYSTIAVQAEFDRRGASVVKYGADITRTVDSSAAFINALQNYETVIIPVGDFRIDSPITILDSYKVRNIIGVNRDVSRLYFTGTDGIVNYKQGLVIDGIGVFGSNKTHNGLDVWVPTVMTNSQIYNFDLGINNANPVHIVTSRFENLVVAYNGTHGIKQVAGGSSQKNAITYKNIYLVKNGTDADTLTSNATTTTGFGMLIDGGYSTIIEKCTYEYNTGFGLKLTSASYPLYGCVIDAPYFERNKYGQMFIDNATGSFSIRSCTLDGEFFTDAGIANVANSLTNRELIVAKPNKELDGYYGNSWGKYSFSDRNFLLRRNNPFNAFPVNFMSDLAIDYPTNIVTYAGESCLTITNTISGVTFFTELVYVDPSYEYLISYDVKKVGPTTSPNLIVSLTDTTTSSVVATATLFMGVAAFDWKTYSVKANVGTSKVLRLYMNIEGTKPADCEVYVKNIRIMPVSKGTGMQTFTTANRPTTGLFVGYCIYDSTLSKPVWYNGTVWKDAMATTV